jgi:uncharacterized protein YbbC (DUF1343 family)
MLVAAVGCAPAGAPMRPRASPAPTVQRATVSLAAEATSPSPVALEATPGTPPALPAIVRVPIEDEEAIDAEVERTLSAHGAPGCVVAMGRRDGVIFRRAYGRRAVDPAPETMTPDTIFDLASVTKAVATATSVMILYERGQLDLDAPASLHLPELGGGAHARITTRQLLLHISGLPPVDLLRDYGEDRAADIARIASLPLEAPPGARVRYTDLGYVLLGELVARVSGRPLERFAHDEIFAPLGMRDTGYLPDASLLARVAPTERAERRADELIRGVVHDPRAWRLGGVSGNAGLFSTVDDLSRFARMMLGGGELEGTRVLRAATVATMTEAHALPGGRRALGWDITRDGMSAHAYGHGGYTGTSLWMDPDDDVFVILLSNRVHPSGEGDVQPLVAALGPIAVEAARHASPPARSPVMTGVDMLEREGFSTLRGAHVALLSHRAARARDGRRTLDVLVDAPEVTVTRVWAPEHGLSGDREGQVRDATDARTGLRVHGLFGRVREPSDAMLEGVDTIVVDLQDVGVRFYTYASTVRRVLEAAKARDLRVVILDRPDPLGGLDPRGPVSEPELASFINHHPLPARHGMTLGELATLLNAERGIHARLEVVEVEGWRRGMSWADTGLRWVPASPNLRTPEEVELYPALALLEGTNVSVGRGTETPFEVIGAPWIDADALREAVGPHPGLRIENAVFTPRTATHRRARCRGLRLVLEDRDAFEPVRTGLAIASAIGRLYPGAWEPERMVQMVGDRAVFAALLAGASLDALEAAWRERLASFAVLRARYLRYPER